MLDFIRAVVRPSLVWVGFSDFYIRMLASGVIRDIRIL